MLIEGAEETGSDDVGEWVRGRHARRRRVIVFDSGMVDAETPALTLATRGMVFAHVEVRTGTQTAHSGMYGGAALNAFHALHQALAAVLPGPDGKLPEPLRAGVKAPSKAEIDRWATLPAGDGRARRRRRPARRRHRGGGVLHPHDGRAVARRPPGRAAGEARTIVVPVASADLSVRLVGGQRSRGDRRQPRRRCCATRCPRAPS